MIPQRILRVVSCDIQLGRGFPTIPKLLFFFYVQEITIARKNNKSIKNRTLVNI